MGFLDRGPDRGDHRRRRGDRRGALVLARRDPGDGGAGRRRPRRSGAGVAAVAHRDRPSHLPALVERPRQRVSTDRRRSQCPNCRRCRVKSSPRASARALSPASMACACTSSRPGSAAPGRPAVLLLHGFPEIAYSWRKVMPALAAAGFHVIAPDQRGYGRTTGWSAELRRRSPAVPAAERRARRAGAGRGARLPLGRVGRRARFRRLDRRLVRAGAARRVPLAGADERAVRRAARPAVRHRAAAAGGRPRARRSTRRWRRCPGRASITSGTTRPGRPMPRCGIAGRASTTSCAPTSTTRAPTGRTTGRIGWPRWIAEELAKMPTYYIMDLPTTCRRRWRRRCRRPRRSPPADG